MAEKPHNALRREFIGLGLTGAMVGLAGCSDSVTIETGGEDDSSNDESEEESDRNVNIDTASFSFSYDDDAQQVTIEFTAGNNIRGGNVEVQQVGGKGVLWAELGSTTAGPDENIEVGDTAVLGPSIFNWETPITPEDTIRLMYTGKETPATLQRYSPPESSDGTSTVPASISGFTLENSAEQQLQISFDSSKQLGSIEVEVSGAESATLARSDFTETASGDESFTYSATYSASSDGTYTATLAQAADTNGTNALNGENISATATINTEEQPSDTTPPSISAFSIANPSGQQLRVSFESDEQLSTVQVDISGPESVTFSIPDFTETSSGSESYAYEVTYEVSSGGDYTATLNEATGENGNNGANSQSVTVNIASIIDDVSDGDISEYTDYTGGTYSVSQERSYSGEYSIKAAGEENAFLADDGELGTVSQGMKFSMRAYLRSSDAEVGILFAVQDEGKNSWYNAEYKAPRNRLAIFRDNEERGYATVVKKEDVELPGGQWLKFEIEWDDGSLGGQEGDITFTVKNDSGEILEEISGNNTFYTSGGIGYNNEADVAYYDYYKRDS